MFMSTVTLFIAPCPSRTPTPSSETVPDAVCMMPVDADATRALTHATRHPTPLVIYLTVSENRLADEPAACFGI
jgi:hypothetical protein